MDDYSEDILCSVRTPCYIVSEDAVLRNCAVLDGVQQRTGAKILLAQKAFSLPAVYPLIARHLHGVCASGPIEARMGREDFGKEVHTYAPAFTEEQMGRVIEYSDHIVFNSVAQWHKHRGRIAESGRSISIGLRCNPGHAEVEIDLYNPCLPGSRFGVAAQDIDGVDLSGIEGLHFHALCEQGADVLERVLESFVERFGKYIPLMKWVNFGGGHHITKPGYDLDLLCRIIARFQSRFPGVQVYLEPGEAVVYQAGVFVTTVLDIIRNGEAIAVVDSSAETHTPDVLAMPYRPQLVGSAEAGEKAHSYRIGGISCLAGDFFGRYSFDKPLQEGDRLVFTDMALYSFVKNTSFNGVELPCIYTSSDRGNSVKLVREFTYDDFRNRLA
ncbi:MAG: carboxynorspermidine decarboxylase [Opitutales bacterium]|nr:carboxynorspermidine decarboxylase [Opitutales bacterium]